MLNKSFGGKKPKAKNEYNEYNLVAIFIFPGKRKMSTNQKKRMLTTCPDWSII